MKQEKKPVELPVACVCGCGTMLPPTNKLGKPSTYAHGHNGRGRVVSSETRKKLSANTTAQMRRQFGPAKKPQDRYRNSPEYGPWRKAALERDEYACRICGATPHHRFLHIHHIKSWAEYPDLRFSLENALTVCVSCHNDIHGWKTGVEPQPCACGCGELCDPRYKFRHGHWTRVRKGIFTSAGHPVSEESRKRMSNAQKARNRSPDIGAAISKAKKGKTHKGHTNSPETKEKMRKTRRRLYEDAEFRLKMGEAVRSAGDRRIAAEPPAYCECGCGTLLPPRVKGRKQIRYISGHQSKGKTPSAEIHTKMSLAARNRKDRNNIQ